MTCFKIAVLCGTTLMAYSQTVKPTVAVAEEVVPFKVITDFGLRTALRASINGFPVTLEVHSNAGFSMQLSHQAAQRGKITSLVHQDEFGIEQAGKVSRLGRDSAFVEQFKISKVVHHHVPVSVFETPSPFDVGMLGLRWLQTNRVVMNYREKQAVLNPRPATIQLQKEQLLRNGYVAIPMRRDPADGRYLAMVTIGTVTLPMIVSTVADVTFDREFAQQVKLPQQDTGGTYGGPTGTTGKVYSLRKPITVRLDTTSFAIPTAAIEDTYAYAAKSRPQNPALTRGGMLGLDFIIAHKAVIDFGNSILYLKK